MSGRALRRLPVLALARYIGIGNLFSSQTTSGASSKESKGAPAEIWLDGMEKAVREHVRESERLN